MAGGPDPVNGRRGHREEDGEADQNFGGGDGDFCRERVCRYFHQRNRAKGRGGRRNDFPALQDEEGSAAVHRRTDRDQAGCAVLATGLRKDDRDAL
ncbi:hypothetical protein D3C76_1643770 [compost metagenome]